MLKYLLGMCGTIILFYILIFPWTWTLFWAALEKIARHYEDSRQLRRQEDNGK